MRQPRGSARLQGHVAYRIHMMTVGPDGALYCGETDRDPYLYPALFMKAWGPGVKGAVVGLWGGEALLATLECPGRGWTR